jgi:hypothetical protein
MPVPRTASREVGLAVQEPRAVLLAMAPILSGAAVPWLLWASLGRVNSRELAAAGLISMAAYLRMVWLIGAHESEARRRLGRRYLAPGPRIALALCGGLVVAVMAPGLSAAALIQSVGLPRAAGVVRSYTSAALAELGGTLNLSGVALSGGPMRLAPDGSAHLLDRDGVALPVALSWQPRAGGLCILIDAIIGDACLSLDPRSGRLSDGGREVGRVTSVGIGGGGRRH